MGGHEGCGGSAGDQRGDGAQVGPSVRVDTGAAPGVPTESAWEIRELKRKCAELEHTIEVLKAATSFFARECDPLSR